MTWSVYIVVIYNKRIHDSVIIEVLRLTTGTLRIIRKSVRFGTRSRKRLFIFICIFAFLSGVTLLAVQNLEAENTEALLSEKAVVVTQNSWRNALESDAEDLIGDVGGGYFSKAYVTKYLDLENSIPGGNMAIKVFGIDSGNPWANTLVKPNDIKSGHFIQGSKQVLLSSDFTVTDGAFEYVPAIGSVINFTAGTETERLVVVGKFEKSQLDSFAWMFVDNELFDDIHRRLEGDYGTINIYTYEVVFMAKGSTILNFLSGDAYTNVEKTMGEVLPLTGGGTPWDNPSGIDIESRKSERGLKQMFLAFGIIGGVIVATMYGFLISRFRTREIAILKAVGYSASSVRIVLLGEILTVSVLGFATALGMIQLGIISNSTFVLQTKYWSNIVFSWTALFSFVIIVLSNGLGILIISRRAVAVRPIELFQSDR
ncbi:MAG: FtsX-like permease family protein [Candidatus Odinarchaeota archaeon]